MNSQQWVNFTSEFVNDPAGLGYAAIRAAFPAYEKPLRPEIYDQLSPAAQTAHDDAVNAWTLALDTEWPTFEGYINTSMVMPERTELSGSEIFESIDIAEFTAITDQQRARVTLVIGLGDNIDVSPGSRARAWLQDAFVGEGGVTVAALLALLPQTQPRWQSLGLSPIKKGFLERLVRENP